MSPLRILGNFIALGIFCAGGTLGVWYYVDHTASQRQIEKLAAENRVLTDVVQRLGDEKRVAQLLVTDQKTVDGVLQTHVLFVEDDKSGKSLPPKNFVIDGNTAHLDAMVIKFDRHFVGEGDPLRGHSIALFTKIYGDKQIPANAPSIDTPGQTPDVYRNANESTRAFEQSLWKDFWRLGSDAEYREKFGVRIANGQGVWSPLEPDKLYTVTLESDGGLNITNEPVKGIYLDAMHKRVASGS